MLKVFIVDDSALVRERLAALVSDLGDVEMVGQASNAREALEGVRRLKPDVVILDIRMPGDNGIQVLETIKVNEAAPVVIVLTAFPYPQYRKKCLEAGAEYFFDKATEFEQVAEVLKKIQSNTTGESAVTPELGLG